MTPKQWMQIAHSCRERDWIRNHNDTIHSGARACQWRRRALRPCTTAPTATGWFKKGKWGEKKKENKRAWCKRSFQSKRTSGGTDQDDKPLRSRAHLLTAVTCTRHACQERERFAVVYMIDHENNHQINLIRRFNDAGSSSAHSHVGVREENTTKNPRFHLFYCLFHLFSWL